MKKSVLAVTAAALALSSALALSGCSNNKTQNLAALNSNWYSFVTYKDIQPTFIGRENAEEIEYEIKFTAPTAYSTNYKVEYSNGTYTTLFYATEFDSNLIHSDFAKSYAGVTNKLTVYYYESKLTTDVKFTFGTESTQTFNDSQTEICYFLPVGDKLRPLYSEQTVVSHTPANLKAGSLDTTYAVIDRVYKNYYEYTGSSVKTELTINSSDSKYDEKKENTSATTTGGLKDSKNILFDRNSLDIAVRAMNLTSSLSQPVSLFSPNGGVQDFTFAGKTAELNDEEKTAFTAKLTSAKLYNKSADDEKGLQAISVDVKFSGSDKTGVTQSYTFAAVENNKNNTGRATLLKKTVPLAYGLGTLEYTITNIKTTLWNK